MVSKLVFKGDKPKKKKKVIGNSKVTKNSTSGAVASTSIYNDDPTWISASSLNDLNGPIIVTFFHDNNPMIVASDLNGKLYLTDNVDIIDGLIEPKRVHQVFVLSKLSFNGTSNTVREQPINNEFAFKNAEGTYLSGGTEINCKAVSIGQDQIFILEYIEEKKVWSIKTSRNKYLSIKSDDSEFGYSIGYSDTVDENEGFVLRVQTKYVRKKVDTESIITDRISTKVLEERAGRKLTSEEVITLKRAYKQGKLNEAFLDIRQKGKSDSFAY